MVNDIGCRGTVTFSIANPELPLSGCQFYLTSVGYTYRK